MENAVLPELDSQLATVLDLLHQVVLDRPDSPAIVHEDRELTFLELEGLSNQFANALRMQGVGPGDRVGLCIERCPEAIAAMLGTMKVGAAFVPLDPEYPMDRIQFMVEDAEIRVVITHDKASNGLAAAMDTALSLDWVDSGSIEFSELDESFGNEADGVAVQVGAADLAYIMYTSGSTGRPKGVQIEHVALTSYCLADIEVYRLTTADRTLQFSTLNFDIAIEEIFPPLLVGSCVVIRPSDRAADVNELSSIVERFDVTAIHLATAYWHEWVDLMVSTQDCVPGQLRLVIATGEKVSVEHFKRWNQICHHDVLWCNAYGPTETTVTATAFFPEESFAGTSMPIGHPLPGYEAWILNDRLEPVAAGETGQLFIGGPALARGYLNRPDLTEKAFIYVDLPDCGTRRLYRTGDLARWLPDESIEFAGRIDHQIKLGSYRIEPGEIEVAINGHGSVLESLVIVEELHGQKFLLAHVAVGDNRVTVEQIVEHVRAGLPAYMVPTRYILSKSFPKTVNGKIDRDALPHASHSQTAASGSYVAPRNELEAKLAELWQAVLNLPSVGVYDDFFALGGSSLLVTRIVAELTNDLDVELPVRDFFANPTIESSARHLQGLLGAEPEIVEGAERAMSRSRELQPQLNAEYIGKGERRLFSVRYQPRCTDPRWSNVRRHGILICHSIGHEYTRAYRNLQQLALILANQGFDVLRFDYFGTGNSTGSCGDLRSETLQGDTRRAAEALWSQADVDTWSLIGVRLGATIAATTDFDRPPQKCILWDPVVDGHQFLRFFQDLHKHELTSQTRFARTVHTCRDEQIFGHSYNDEKRVSLGRLQLPKSSCVANRIILSADYLNCEPRLAEFDAWEQVQTRDDIHWHDPKFTGSAFSAPEAFREIQQFLSEGPSN